MARPIKVPDSVTVSVRIESGMYDMLKEISALETLATGTVISTNQLIRDCLNYMYSDNERMRECFRRSREQQKKRYKKYCL